MPANQNENVRELMDHISNPFLRTYMNYTENTESPKLFHIWSAISGVAAVLGRKAWYDLGDLRTFPNMYVVLVGPPASRKSTAANVIKKILLNSVTVRFAPDDTGGQRQGLIKAIIGEGKDVAEDDDETIASALAAADLGALSDIKVLGPEEKNVMYVHASEFNTLLTKNAEGLLNFFIKMFDGEDYEYTLKGDQDVLREPLLNILAGTTPTQISSALPPESIGQGFMSRLILVYADRKAKSLPRPPKGDEKLKAFLESKLTQIDATIRGPFRETPDAQKFIDKLYDKHIDMKDPRFAYYLQRRHTHLIKLVQNLAAMRGSMLIEKSDVEEANLILSFTEVGMPDALGEFGLSPLSLAKQRMLEFLRNAGEPMSVTALLGVMHKDMKRVDFYNAVTELVNSNKIEEIMKKDGTVMLQAVNADLEENQWDALADLLSTGGPLGMLEAGDD